MVDSEEIVWGWLNGLVRRAAIGHLLYLLFAVACCLLVLSAVDRGNGLEDLGTYSNDHSRLTESFVDMAGHATELAGSPARAPAMSAIEPLRRSVIEAKRVGAEGFGCADAWIAGLRHLQRIPAKIASNCPSSFEKCEIPHEKLLLEDLVGFEQGMATVEDLLPALERACLGSGRQQSFCTYYLVQRDRDIQALNGLVSSHYREPLPASSAAEGRGKCEAERTFLTARMAIAARIDPSARAQTLADFERLGETIREARVAIRSADTRISASPGGGILTLLIPKNISFPLLHLLCLTASLYAYLHIHRLLRLTRAYALPSERLLYALYPQASHIFTAPVFGGSARRQAGARLRSHMPALLTVAFDLIPYVALGLAAVSALAAAVLATGLTGLSGAEEFSSLAVVISLALVVLQAIVTWGYRVEQRAVRRRFDEWIQAEAVQSGHQPGEGNSP